MTLFSNTCTKLLKIQIIFVLRNCNRRYTIRKEVNKQIYKLAKCNILNFGSYMNHLCINYFIITQCAGKNIVYHMNKSISLPSLPSGIYYFNRKQYNQKIKFSLLKLLVFLLSYPVQNKLQKR